MPVSLVNAFNPNDGPAPYTAVSAEFILDNQQAIFGLEVIDIPPAPYQMHGEIRPTIILLYRDGTGATRTKFIHFSLQVNQNFPRPAAPAPASFDFYISVKSGTIAGLSVSGNSLTFTANLTLDILGFENQPQHFAILPDFTCAAPPQNYPSTCVDVIGLHSFCTLGVDSHLVGIIPFRQEGTPPYNSPSVETLPVLPNVLFAANTFDGIDLQLSFPAILRFNDANGDPFVQNVYIIGNIGFIGPFLDADEVVFVDLRITSMTPPFFTSSAVMINMASIAGTITVMRNHAAQTLVTPLVSCGPFPVDSVCVQESNITSQVTIPSM